MWPEVRTRAFLGRDAGMTSRECPLRCPYNLVQRNESRVARSTWYLILSHHSSDSRVLVGPAAAPSMPNCFACCCTSLSVVLRPRSTAVCLLCHAGPHCVEPTLAGPTFMRIYLRSSYCTRQPNIRLNPNIRGVGTPGVSCIHAAIILSFSDYLRIMPFGKRIATSPTCGRCRPGSNAEADSCNAGYV